MAATARQATDDTTEKTPVESLKFIEAGMNLAGFNNPDPYLKELLRQCIYGEISSEECKVAGMHHILSRA